MTINTKLTEKDYINASFAIIIGRPFIRYFLAIIGIILLINLVSGIAIGSSTLAGVLPPIIIFMIYLGFIYFSIKRGYSNNKRISENIEYTFGQFNLVIVGESFKTELSWNKVNKVTKTKNWLLIWQTRQIANAIPNRDIQADELTKLKMILTNNSVKNNL
jgi:hypothetical protein